MDNENSTANQPKQSLAIPFAIVFGFALIAAAIYFSNTGASLSALTGNNGPEQLDESVEINPVTEDDHIRGNPNAPVMVVEYSDFDCPYCKSFHETMTAIMDEFGASGEVAWVYRQFPIQSLHPSAPFLAEASECVAKVGGNDAFWTFADLIFSERSLNEATNLVRLPEFAETAGVNVEEYQSCLDNGETRSLVEEDFNNARDIGARGTPYSVVLVGDQQLVINGAQPYDVVRQMIAGLTGNNTN